MPEIFVNFRPEPGPNRRPTRKARPDLQLCGEERKNTLKMKPRRVRKPFYEAAVQRIKIITRKGGKIFSSRFFVINPVKLLASITNLTLSQSYM